MVNGKNALESFKDHLISLKPKRTSITALKWSDELAYSASMFVKEMEGCSVYANQLWKDGHQDEHLRKIATFTEHKRFALYPEKIRWTDAQEFAWDVLLDERSDNHEIRDLLLNGLLYNQIGMACDCDSEFGEFCILEIGKDVEFTDHYKSLWGKDFSHEVWMPLLNVSQEIDNIGEWYDGPSKLWSRRRNLMAALPEYRLKGDPHCPSGNTEKFCGQTYDAQIDVQDLESSGFLNLDERLKGFAIDLVTEVNFVQAMSYEERADYIWNPLAIDELKNWPENVPTNEFFVWNEALANAAQHVAQIEGPCGTFGDANADGVEQVLSKYYAYSYKNLQIMKIESTELIREGFYPKDVYDRFMYDSLENSNKYIDKWDIPNNLHQFNFGPAGSNYMDAAWAFEYILSQTCYDKHMLEQTNNLQIGVGCSCSSQESKVTDNNVYLCYIVVARDVVAKKVVERIPENQAYLRGYESCRSKCPFFFGEDGLWTDVDDCYAGSAYDEPLNSTDIDDVVDGNRWCKACSELETKCVECDNKEGCLYCEQNFGEFDGHSWPAT